MYFSGNGAEKPASTLSWPPKCGIQALLWCYTVGHPGKLCLAISNRSKAGEGYGEAGLSRTEAGADILGGSL